MCWYTFILSARNLKMYFEERSTEMATYWSIIIICLGRQMKWKRAKCWCLVKRKTWSVSGWGNSADFETICNTLCIWNFWQEGHPLTSAGIVQFALLGLFVSAAFAWLMAWASGEILEALPTVLSRSWPLKQVSKKIKMSKSGQSMGS